MLRSMPYGCIRRSFPFLLSGLAIAACANSGQSVGNPDSGGGGSGSSSGAIGAGSSSGASGGSSGAITIAEAGPGSGDACQQFDVKFARKIPFVYVLVDRSGSMFQLSATADGGQSDEWSPLRTATLGVIQSLQGEVAFGFGAYTGINPNTTPGMCPILVTVPIALNNYSAISAVYTPLGQPAFKAETPAQMSLDTVAQTLVQAEAQAADAGTGLQTDAGAGQPGGKYILFVTDGETDFCDDGNAVCPADAVIAELQKLSMQGIQTLILGVGSSQSNISVPVLQAFANAGAGTATLAPPGSAAGAPLAPTDIYNQCNSVTGWNQLFTAARLQSGQALGTYAPAGTTVTNAALYSPVATDVTDLANKLSAALSGVKSCSFDLQGKIKVDLPNAGQGHVTIDGTPVPFDPTNGWTMTTATQLDLVGSACQQWRATGTDISFDFPCQIIIVVAQ
jgi:hypothetical protein